MQLLLSSSPNWYLSHVVAAAEDGSVVAYAGHLSVTVLCCQQQQILRCLWPQRIRVSCVTFAAGDSLLVAGYEDGSARCFDWRTGECVCIRAASKAKRRQSSSEMTAVVAPSWLDNTAVFADAGGRLLLWPFTADPKSKYSVLAESVGSKVVCLTAAPNTQDNSQQQLQQVLAGCLDGSCVLVDVGSGCQLAKWKAHAAAVHSLTWVHASQGTNTQQQQTAVTTDLAAPQLQDLQQQQQQQDLRGFVVSVGADRRVKVWQVPPLGAPVTTSQQPAAATAATPPVSEQLPAAEVSENHTETSTAAAAATAVAVADQPAAGERPTAPAASPAAAAAPASTSAVKQQPAVLQLQPLSAAAVDPAPPSSGPRALQYYGAAAVVPGSVCGDGSCVVLCAGVNGRIGVAVLVSGRPDCQWSALPKSPHTGGIFQLLLQPVNSQQQQQQGEAACVLTGPQAGGRVQEQQQQQQQQQQLALAGDYQVLSVSMDRCFAQSKLTMQQAALPSLASPAAAAAAAAAGPTDGSTSSTDKSILVLPLPSQLSFSSSSSRSSSSTNVSMLQLRGCSAQWVCQGLGGFAYSCAVQPTYPDAAEVYPRYSKVRLAVGCGDKTIRVASLGVRAAPPEQQQQQQQQTPAAADPVDAAVLACFDDTDPHTGSSSSSGKAHHVAGQSVCELQLPVPKPTLLWRNIQDRAQAIAWHPTNPRLFAFGCHDGSLGVCDCLSSHITLYGKRHGGPVTHIAWHQQQQQQQGTEASLTLLSLGGEGCLLSWPAITPGTGSSSSSRAQPSDFGAQLQGLLARGLQKVVGVGREMIFWSRMAVSACGGWMAVCSTKGQVMLLSSSSSSDGVRSADSSGSSRWRRGADYVSRAGPWQLTAYCRTPGDLPIKAAAWQPQAQQHGTGAPAAAAAAAVSESVGTGASSDALLAAVDEQNLYLLSSSSSSSSSSGPGDREGGGRCLVASCGVQAAQQQQQQQQQLLSLAWSASDVVCVGCSDGSIQVVKVLSASQPLPAAAAAASFQLLPLHSLRGHTGPVLCVSGLPGWPGLLLSGSQDQTVRSWQPLLEAATTPATLQTKSTAAAAAAAAAATTAAAGSEEQQQSVTAGSGAVAGADVVCGDAAKNSGASRSPEGQSRLQRPAPAAAAAQPSLEVPQEQPAAGQLAASQSAAAKATAAGAAAAGAGVRKSKQKAIKLFICPKAKTFLPDLPDTTNPMVQQQALLDVVALAEALYPPAAAAGSGPGPAAAPAAAGNGATAAAGMSGVSAQCSLGPDAEVLALLGLPAVESASAGSISSDDQQQQQLQAQQQQGCVLGVAETLKQQLAGVAGADYPLGPWLPNMTADVPELLLQHQAWTSQHPQQQQQQQLQQHRQQGKKFNRFAGLPAEPTTVSAGGAVGALTVSQLGMLKFVAGDVKGFLQAAAAADSVTPDVVALSAAGGAPAFGAAARLAAAKLTAAGDHEAAAVHLKAAGDGSVEGAALT